MTTATMRPEAASIDYDDVRRSIRATFSVMALAMLVLSLIGAFIIPNESAQVYSKPHTQPNTYAAKSKITYDEQPAMCVDKWGTLASCQVVQSKQRAGLYDEPAQTPVQPTPTQQFVSPRGVPRIPEIAAPQVSEPQNQPQQMQSNVYAKAQGNTGVVVLGGGRIEGNTAYLSDGRVIQNFNPRQPYFEVHR